MKTSTHIIILTVTTENPVLGLEELIADRAWRIDGVSHTEAELVLSVPGERSDWVVNVISDAMVDMRSADKPAEPVKA
jgi:hypothetical protein